MYGMMEAQKLNEYELENVTGGSYSETANDTAVIMFTPGHLTENRVKREWAKYGIDYEYHGGAIYDNKYRINGKDVSRDEAYAHARAIAWGK